MKRRENGKEIERKREKENRLAHVNITALERTGEFPRVVGALSAVSRNSLSERDGGEQNGQLSFPK